MPREDDQYAILVAINRYPGLSDLKGPENDAEAFKEWLLDENGGNIKAEHIETICSSQFAVTTEPDDANPSETQFKKALNRWVKPNGDWAGRVGKRLYLFFAGHGFTTGSISDPALFTAQAQLGDTAHIAGFRYASKIQNAGFFDEIILLMDCCQDVLKAAQVSEPTWSPPDNKSSSSVKFMQAYGAPRGRRAFETPDTNNSVHGYFSSVLVEALKTAPADSDYYVTARAVNDKFSDIWTSRYLKLTGYEPPFVTPRDLKLYRRIAKAPDGPDLIDPLSIDNVTDNAIPPTDNGVQDIVGGAPSSYPPSLPPMQSVPGSAKFCRADIPTVEVTIHSSDPGAEIRVLDEQMRRIKKGVGHLKLRLEIGHYRARFRVGDEVKEVAFSLHADDKERLIENGLLEFSSPIPLPDTSTHHEYQYGPASELGDEAVGRSYEAGFPNSVGTLLVFARDSDHPLASEWKMAKEVRGSLRLRKIDEETGRPRIIPCNVKIDHSAGFASLLLTDLAPGSYLLGTRRIERKRSYWQEMVLTIAASWWRTEVYFDSIDDDQTGRRYDIETASVLIGPGKGGNSLYGSKSRFTEVARQALAEGRVGVDENLLHWVRDMGMPEPMLALYTAYALAGSEKPDVSSVRQICEHLKERWTRRSADVILLEMWCASKDQKIDRIRFADFRPDEVPMIARGWEIARQVGVNVEFGLGVQQNVGLWRTSATMWTQTSIPEGAEDLFSRVDTSAKHSSEQLGSEFVTRVGEAFDWTSVARSVTNPLYSPVHQALRRVAIEAAESQSLAELLQGIENIRIAFGLDGRVISAALNDVFSATSSNIARGGDTAIYLTT
jgi:Caspase domain